MVNKGSFELSDNIEEKLQKKKITALFIFILLILIIILTFIWLKYEVEGAKGLPFEIEEVLVISTADGKRIENKDKKKKDKVEVSQVNDVFIKIKEKDKDNNYTNIRKIVIGNFELNKPETGEIVILEPSGDIPDLFSNSTKNYLEKEIEYKGAKVDNLEQLETSGKGGTIAFRIENKLGSFDIAKDEVLKYDSSLLNKFVKKVEEIKFKLKFNINIELENGFIYITGIELKKPVEEVFEENKSVYIEDIDDISFRKI